jgi:hypothetical protein
MEKDPGEEHQAKGDLQVPTHVAECFLSPDGCSPTNVKYLNIGVYFENLFVLAPRLKCAVLL